MDEPRMLSGSELVAKGVKKDDLKLPQSGCKDVSPSGSWLEQKQIQSALEARKHLIEVERIDKIGTISHAIWRDDLNLAEVTQKVGPHWNYIGHNVGKTLYLQPEETLFLIEVNGLLLKHNEVTVSLQKAYTLCLGEISIAQYKVYASLSRLGYKVLRHQDPTATSKSKVNKFSDVDNVYNNVKNHSSDISLNNNEKSNFINDDNNDILCNDSSEELKYENIDEKTLERRKKSNDIAVVNNVNSVVQSDNDSDLSYPLIDADNVKVEIVENHTGSEISENDINNAIEKTLRSSGIDPSNESKGNGDEIAPMDLEIELTPDQGTISENVQNGVNIRDNTDSLEEERKILTVMNIDYNVNETIAPPTDNNENIVRIRSANEDVEIANFSTISSDIVYSVDESGVIRAFREEFMENMETDDEESKAVKSTKNFTDKTETQDPSSKGESLKPYEMEIKYYKAKMQKLINRKPSQRRNCDGLNTIQDFYRQEVVAIKVPDEKILPRNIFLYKTAYTLNLDTVRNQNATNANVSGDEMDVGGSRSSRGTDAPSFSELPRFGPNHPYDSPRYPHYRPFFRLPNEWMYRHNLYYGYNMFRPPMQAYFSQQRYRFQPFLRQQFENYNQSDTSKRNTMKTLHFNTIVSIAARFRNISGTAPHVDALYRLVTTYNSHYGEHIELTRDFEIVDRKAVTVDVVVLDDETKPKRKKQRPNEDSEIDSNLERLKALAAKLKELQTRGVAVSRHRRVFSNAIKTFNKTYNSEVYLDSDIEIKDRKLIVLDSSSESDVVCVKEKGKRRKRRKLRNPYSVLKYGLRNVNEGASTSRGNPEIQSLTPKPSDINIDTKENGTCDDITASTEPNSSEYLLKYFHNPWLRDDFGRPAICSRECARLDTILFETEYMVLKEKTADFDNWLDVKIAILTDIERSLNLHKEQTEALSHDFLMETESLVQPIVRQDCRDSQSVLKQLAIIPTNNEISKETSLKIDFDVCNRNIHFKKTSPPKPHFRVICLDESAPFPSSEDIAALNAKYKDGVPAAFAFVGSGSISYLQINAIDLPVFISDSDLT